VAVLFQHTTNGQLRGADGLVSIHLLPLFLDLHRQLDCIGCVI
jgi:hypothetical protein